MEGFVWLGKLTDCCRIGRSEGQRRAKEEDGNDNALFVKYFVGLSSLAARRYHGAVSLTLALLSTRRPTNGAEVGRLDASIESSTSELE